MSNRLNYLDKIGLKKIFTLIKNWDLIAAKPTCQDANGDLVPGQKIVELTKAQYDALTTKDPDTYYMVNDDNDPKTWYTRPDWSHAVPITVNISGYTVPVDGMIVGWGLAGSNPTDIQINNIPVGITTNAAHLSIQCPVCQGDVVKSGGYNFQNARFNFIPWK